MEEDFSSDELTSDEEVKKYYLLVVVSYCAVDIKHPKLAALPLPS